jgi:hypothetical protein
VEALLETGPLKTGLPDIFNWAFECREPDNISPDTNQIGSPEMLSLLLRYPKVEYDTCLTVRETVRDIMLEPAAGKVPVDVSVYTGNGAGGSGDTVTVKRPLSAPPFKANV